MGRGLGLWWIVRNAPLDWRAPRLADIRQEFRESGVIFVSRVWITLYTSLIPTILGAFAGAAAVGHYVLADKIRMVVQSLLSPAAQALFPRMSYLFSNDRGAALHLLKRSGAFMICVSGAASLGLFFLAEPIIRLAAGEDFAQSVTVLRWLAPLPLVVYISQIASLQILLTHRKDRQFNLILLSGGVFGLAASWKFISAAHDIGAAQFLLCVEVLICVAMWVAAAHILKCSVSRG